MPRFDMNAKVALVTGGARGIGFETARALAARGASVVILDLDARAASSAAESLSNTRALGVGADVSDRGAMEHAVTRAVEQLGRLDITVANAGVGPRYTTVRATAVERFDRVIDVNLMGVVNTVRATLPEIVRNSGHLVLVASVYAFQNGAGVASYAMSKAAVEQLGRALRLELVPHGASASVAYFGLIDTDMVHQAIDGDPAVNQLFAALPKPFIKRLQPDRAGEAIVRGIERRSPRIIRPRLYAGISALRGIVGPLADHQMERDKRVQAAITEFDQRADQEQPLTA
jgi:NAD(P)-dependent dehydrogenase (short-subunit alcohol dehydrogenase family)